MQETLTEVIPQLNTIKDQLFQTQDAFSKLCDPAYLEQMKEKHNEIINRLASTEKRLRLCYGSEEEPNVDEINAWLSQIEDKLNKLDKVPVDKLNDKHFEECKLIQTEIMETKPKIIQLQRYSYFSKVSEVCKRWEDISNRIQVSRLFMFQINYTTYVDYCGAICFVYVNFVHALKKLNL